MKKFSLAAIAIALTTALTLFTLEGVYSIVKGKKQHSSVTYQALNALKSFGRSDGKPTGAYAPYFSERSELSALIPLIRESAVGVGNSPFKEAKTKAAAINTTVDGCPALKPMLRKKAFFLRTNAFNPFDPPSIFLDADKEIDQRLNDFFDRYGTRPVNVTTNAAGERTTLPILDRSQKVLVAGDSVAFGAMVDDSETISSQLQARDRERQYINLGVAGADAEAIICRLEQMAQRYDGVIDELIYVYCENDLKPKRPYGKPHEVIKWLKEFAARQGIDKITIVFSPYIYMVAPQNTRIVGDPGYTYPNRVQGRLTLAQEVKKAGFGWVDFGEIARAAIVEDKSQFAFFRLYADRNHMSPEGVRRVVDRIFEL